MPAPSPRAAVGSFGRITRPPAAGRNALLLTAGYAPVYPHTAIDDPSLRPSIDAIRQILMAHDPFPALMTDRIGTLLAGNEALEIMLEGVAPQLLIAPVNVRRLALHPKGLAPRVLNFGEWGRHVTEMIRRQIDRRPDADEAALLSELDAYVDDQPVKPSSDYMGLATPLHLTSSAGDLKLLMTVTSFNTAIDVTIAELRLEAFVPADANTAARLESLQTSRRSNPPRPDAMSVAP